MGLRLIVSGHLIRYPLGGFSWHHLQYLLGFAQLGHEVTYFEHYGWENSCYDPQANVMTANPAYGITYFTGLLQSCRLKIDWCYLAEDGRGYGLDRESLAQRCRESDVYFNLSNINWIAEIEHCRRRVLVDTDPVFTQIGAHGLGGPFSRYHALFTYGENVHRPGCTIPAGGNRWLPTRQPVVAGLWPFEPGDPAAPFTTVMNWSAYGDHVHEGHIYGQKDREFEPYFPLPAESGEPMELAINAPPHVRNRLVDGGWRLADPLVVTRTPAAYRRYVAASRAEFSVAKHAYVSTHSGWFSDRSCAYLAMGRPVVLQDTGFSEFLPCGRGLLTFRTPAEALSAVRSVAADYEEHCQAARRIVEEYFDAGRVLTEMLEKSV